MNSSHTPSPKECATAAAEFAQGAGNILLNLFGKQVEVDYKNKAKTDPVSEADTASQDFLSKAIAARYPDHAVLGEEKPADKDEAKRESENETVDYLWVLDPLDGTKNFLNGLSIWGCSVGLLHKGRPVAGAIFTPESTPDTGGVIYRAWEGGGAYRGEQPIEVASDDRPTAKRIASFPGAYWMQFRPKGPLKSGMGEVRATGSITYELSLVARGGLHYALFGAPNIWDVAAGIIIVREAGGDPLVRRGGTDHWDSFDAFFSQGPLPIKVDAVRKWQQSLIVGNSSLCRFVSSNLKKVNRPHLSTRNSSKR